MSFGLQVNNASGALQMSSEGIYIKLDSYGYSVSEIYPFSETGTNGVAYNKIPGNYIQGNKFVAFNTTQFISTYANRPFYIAATNSSYYPSSGAGVGVYYAAANGDGWSSNNGYGLNLYGSSGSIIYNSAAPSLTLTSVATLTVNSSMLSTTAGGTTFYDLPITTSPYFALPYVINTASFRNVVVQTSTTCIGYWATPVFIGSTILRIYLKTENVYPIVNVPAYQYLQSSVLHKFAVGCAR